MTISHKSVIALITSVILLLATAIALYVYGFGSSSMVARAERKNHSETRAAFNLTAPNIGND
jgi:flagellar basal body-associated protein FliL